MQKGHDTINNTPLYGTEDKWWHKKAPNDLLFVDKIIPDLTDEQVAEYGSRTNIPETQYVKELRELEDLANEDADHPVIFLSLDELHSTFIKDKGINTSEEAIKFVINEHKDRIIQQGKFKEDDFYVADDEYIKYHLGRLEENSPMCCHLPHETDRSSTTSRTHYIVTTSPDESIENSFMAAANIYPLSQRSSYVNYHELGHALSPYNNFSSELFARIKEECFADSFAILYSAKKTKNIYSGEFAAEERVFSFILKIENIRKNLITNDIISDLEVAENEELIYKNFQHLTFPVTDKALDKACELLASGEIKKMSTHDIILMAKQLTDTHIIKDSKLQQAIDSFYIDDEPEARLWLQDRVKTSQKKLNSENNNITYNDLYRGSYCPPEIWKHYVESNTTELRTPLAQAHFIYDALDESRKAADECFELEERGCGVFSFSSRRNTKMHDIFKYPTEVHAIIAKRRRKIPDLNISGHEALGKFICHEQQTYEKAIKYIESSEDKKGEFWNKIKPGSREAYSQKLSEIIRNDEGTWNLVVEEAPEIARMINAKSEGMVPRFLNEGYDSTYKKRINDDLSIVNEALQNSEKLREMVNDSKKVNTSKACSKQLQPLESGINNRPLLLPAPLQAQPENSLVKKNPTSNTR
ncbi:MAG: hypothetical protein GY804_01280, partial [Alphaproteobacteria bacterium]|nr:hypothetical protein [Alphaproteobacteria bacterium]